MQMCSYKAEHCSLNQFTIKNQAHSDNLNSHNSNDNKNMVRNKIQHLSTRRSAVTKQSTAV